jgi:hypothetical protein
MALNELNYVSLVQCAPMTNSLATIQDGKNEKIPDLSFRRVSDDSLFSFDWLRIEAFRPFTLFMETLIWYLRG